MTTDHDTIKRIAKLRGFEIKECELDGEEYFNVEFKDFFWTSRAESFEEFIEELRCFDYDRGYDAVAGSW